MAFYCFPCPPDEYEKLLSGKSNDLVLPLNGATPKDGDILRLDEHDDEFHLTGEFLYRLVIRSNWSVDWHGLRFCSLTLVSLDHPPLRQLELTNPEAGTFVYWVEDRDQLVGTRITLRGQQGEWTVSQTATSLLPHHLPEQARIGFID